MNTLVLFVFHEYNSRVQKFIKKSIFQSQTIDFLIICNNKRVKFEYPDYVNILYRNNIGFDFGGYSDALLKNLLYQKYDNFIFVNSSVDGPYLPQNFNGKWTDFYINGLNENKLFGSTINTLSNWQNNYYKMVRLFGGDISKTEPQWSNAEKKIKIIQDKPFKYAHIQSYIFSMNKKTLEYLINCGIFSITRYAKTFKEAIYKEVLMSCKIIEKGWDIGCLMPIYKNIDFKSKNENDYNIPLIDDPMQSKYKDVYWNKYDLIFIKGNRNI